MQLKLRHQHPYQDLVHLGFKADTEPHLPLATSDCVSSMDYIADISNPALAVGLDSIFASSIDDYGFRDGIGISVPATNTYWTSTKLQPASQPQNPFHSYNTSALTIASQSSSTTNQHHFHNGPQSTLGSAGDIIVGQASDDHHSVTTAGPSMISNYHRHSSSTSSSQSPWFFSAASGADSFLVASDSSHYHSGSWMMNKGYQVQKSPVIASNFYNPPTPIISPSAPQKGFGSVAGPTDSLHQSNILQGNNSFNTSSGMNTNLFFPSHSTYPGDISAIIPPSSSTSVTAAQQTTLTQMQVPSPTLSFMTAQSQSNDGAAPSSSSCLTGEDLLKSVNSAVAQHLPTIVSHQTSKTTVVSAVKLTIKSAKTTKKPTTRRSAGKIAPTSNQKKSQPKSVTTTTTTTAAATIKLSVSDNDDGYACNMKIEQSRTAAETITETQPLGMAAPMTTSDKKAIRRCNNCHTTTTNSWRRGGINKSELLCNRCGLFWRDHNHHRPHNLSGRALHLPRTARARARQPGVCDNCQVTDSPAWRRGPVGERLCNACGIYWQQQKQHRPQHLQSKLTLTTSSCDPSIDKSATAPPPTLIEPSASHHIVLNDDAYHQHPVCMITGNHVITDAVLRTLS